MKTNSFVNPYTFIPFAKKNTELHEKSGEHTGYIEYTITTKTPLFIPNTSNDAAFKLGNENEDNTDHKSYDFFSYNILEKRSNHEKVFYDDIFFDPVIPGSEIRGMIRSLYETITDSCACKMNVATYPSRRSFEIFKPGLIYKENGKYELWTAKDCIYKIRNGIKTYKVEKTKEGSKVYFNCIKQDKGKSLIEAISLKKDSTHMDEGYLIKGEKGPAIGKKEKHNAHVFKKEVKCRDFTKKNIEQLNEILRIYKMNGNNKYEEYSQQWEKFKDQEEMGFFPVYYSDVNNKVFYYSPASITREVSSKSIGELANNVKACSAGNSACPACNLFGLISDQDGQSRGSKIRFTDATTKKGIDAKDCYDPIITLETLNTPKLGNVEFYLERPKNAEFWTYDYYIENGKIIPYTAVLRGRKFYWHHPNFEYKKGIKKTNLNKTIRPVKQGISFTGRLYFDRISDKQFNQLKWLMNGGDKNTLCYKIGSGKPLGLGSIRLKINNVKERSYVGQEYSVKSVESLKIENYIVVGFNATVEQAFSKLMNFDTLDKQYITYPRTADQMNKPMDEGFKWFVENHLMNKPNRMGNKRLDMKIVCELPDIMDNQEIENTNPQGASQRRGRNPRIKR